MAPDDLRDPDGNVGIDNVKDPGIKIYWRIKFWMVLSGAVEI